MFFSSSPFANGEIGISYYQESIDRLGFWRKSDHWGNLGPGSGYSLNVNFADIGGRLVPGESNLWLFDRPVTGFVKYSDIP